MSSDIPQHVAIIMDGNGRWAARQNLARTQGHLEGVKRVEEIVIASVKQGLKVLTLFTFSTENWNRPNFEITMLMKTFVSMLNKKVDMLDSNNVQLRMIGRRSGTPSEVLKTIDKAVAKTAKNDGLILNIAFNYGGRQEIIDGIIEFTQAVQHNAVELASLTVDNFSQYLYTRDLPDPDLLIRTSGERRISNFLLWQLSYAEFYFTDKYWPEFNEEQFLLALNDYKHRERRYGGVKE